MGIGLRSRKFGSKNYYFARIVSTKREAQKMAKDFRKRGDRHARITQEGSSYAIWVRGSGMILPTETQATIRRHGL